MENNDEARTVAERASTSKEEPLEATADDDYGCEHYKRKSKFVVSSQPRSFPSRPYSVSTFHIVLLAKTTTLIKTHN